MTVGGKSRSMSEYKAVWLFTMFDLPVDDKVARRAYVRFRKTLLKYGFSMLQYSVYARYFPSEDASEMHRRRIRAELPPEGQVRLVAITDRQFGKMEVYYGKKRKPPRDPPHQLMFF